MPTLAETPSTQPVESLSPAARHKLEGIVQTALADEIFPAAALTVVHQGQVLLNAAWGDIDPETRQHPAKTDTLFDLASVTKMFTVTAFLSLMNKKGVSLDHPLVALVPEFGETGERIIDGGQDPHTKITLPTPDDVRGKKADPARVTFRHLLTHTSGIAPWREVYRAAGTTPPPPTESDPLTPQQRWANALKYICEAPFVGFPGDGVVRYSDLGLMLLGESTARLYNLAKTLDDVERAAHADNDMPLENAIHARVAGKLNLPSIIFNPVRNGIDKNTITPTEQDPLWRRRRVWGEVHDENACGVGGIAGHAGLFGTARDIAALGQAWLENDPRLDIPTDVMDDAKRQHAQTGDTRRGLGWVLKAVHDSAAGDVFSENTYGHTGFTGTSLWIDPDKALVVSLMTNRVYPGRELEGIHEFRRAVHTVVAEGL